MRQATGGVTRVRKGALILGILGMLWGMGLLAAPAGTLAAPAGAPAWQAACDNPPDQDATVTPKCGPAGTQFLLSVTGFTPNVALSFWITDPQGRVVGTPSPFAGQHPGHLENIPINSTGFGDGIWAVTFQGAQSNHVS